MRVVFLWAGIVGTLNLLIYAVTGHGIIMLLTSIAEYRRGRATSGMAGAHAADIGLGLHL